MPSAVTWHSSRRSSACCRRSAIAAEPASRAGTRCAWMRCISSALPPSSRTRSSATPRPRPPHSSSRTEQELVRRQSHIGDREAAVERQAQEIERQRAETLNAARNEARELLSKAQADAARELQEAEARGARLLEQSRHQATELTNAARAEVEQTLEWARNQGRVVIGRAQEGAEQLLGAAGLGPDAIAKVAAAIMHSAEQSNEDRPLPPTAALAGPPTSVAAPPEPEGSEPSEPQP